MKMYVIVAVINATWAVVEVKPAKYSVSETHDLCDTGAVLYQLSQQAN